MSTPPSGTRATLINITITNLIQSGLWAKLDVLYIFAAATSQAGLLNWKARTNDCTLVSAPSFTADRGFTGNGTSSYVESNFNPATQGVLYTQDAASFGVWSRTSGQMASSCAGWFDGTDGVTLLPRGVTDTAGFRINQTLGSSTDAVVTDGTGLFAANRSGASATQFYRNGGSLNVGTSPNQASTALNSATLRFGSSSVAGFSALQHAAGFAGGNLSAGDQAALYTILLNYMTQVGAA